ncbi:lipoyl synthase, partial [Candidatus Dependentiae bacterium]|nr:lipoyl synthase [Candidatus Dependentiae bacterium]
SRTGYDVVKYYHPDEFSEIKEFALKSGFKQVLSGPLVRSSYHAMEQSRPALKKDSSIPARPSY